MYIRIFVALCYNIGEDRTQLTFRSSREVTEVEDLFFPFHNDRMFCTVLAGNEELAKEILETILEKEIGSIECVDAQKTLNYTPDAKSVRFDICLKDGAGVNYDLEMETAHNRRRLAVLPLRSRMYSSAIDAEEYPRGTGYGDMKNTWIIFICLKDPFGYGLARYTVKPVCAEDGTVPGDDGIRHVYLNCEATVCNVSDELMALLSYIRDRSECRTELTKKIDEIVVRINDDKNWRRWAMTFEEQLRDSYQDGAEYGEKKGELRGIKKGELRGIKKGELRGIKKGEKNKETELVLSMIRYGLDDTAIASITGTMTPDDITEVRRKLMAG